VYAQSSSIVPGRGGMNEQGLRASTRIFGSVTELTSNLRSIRQAGHRHAHATAVHFRALPGTVSYVQQSVRDGSARLCRHHVPAMPHRLSNVGRSPMDSRAAGQRRAITFPLFRDACSSRALVPLSSGTPFTLRRRRAISTATDSRTTVPSCSHPRRADSAIRAGDVRASLRARIRGCAPLSPRVMAGHIAALGPAVRRGTFDGGYECRAHAQPREACAQKPRDAHAFTRERAGRARRAAATRHQPAPGLGTVRASLRINTLLQVRGYRPRYQPLQVRGQTSVSADTAS